MRKTYKSRTILSLVLSNSRRVAFEPTSDDGSMFTTGNIELQRMLEEHPWFGKKFSLSSDTLAAMRRAAREQQAPASDKSSTTGKTASPSAKEKDQSAPTPKIEKITVSGLADAKEILAERYEIMRTQLKTKAAILAAAKEHNIEFVGL
ncbi:MAG: hypothetical protein K6E73_10790 [Bacteroidales bacterium]|nr:hypothetical protein [Bacteroidales bacterium]